MACFSAVLRIHEILVPTDPDTAPRVHTPTLMDPDSDPDPAIFLSDLQDVKKSFCFLLFEGKFT